MELYYKGVGYTSLKELCKSVSVPYDNVYYHVKTKGRSVEEAVELVKSKLKSYKVRGKIFNKIINAFKDFEDEVEVTYNVVRNRVSNGWDLEEALFAPPSNDYSFEIDGKIFSNKPEAAKYYSISINTVEARLSKGWSLRDALKTPSQRTRDKVIVKDSKGNAEEFSSKAEASRKLNTTSYKSRLSDGWLISDLKKYKTLKEFRNNFGVGCSSFTKAFKKTGNVRSAMALATKRKRINSRTSKKKGPSERANRYFNRPRHKQATPRWVEKDEIYKLYKKALGMDDYELDHIIPINHDLVCGLHVPSNLRIITREENRKKSNNFEVG